MMTNSMFLLTVPSCADGAPAVMIGLFESEKAVYDYMEKFRVNAWLFTVNGNDFVGYATTVEELIAHYSDFLNIENVRPSDRAAYNMNRSDVPNGFCKYDMIELPVFSCGST